MGQAMHASQHPAHVTDADAAMLRIERDPQLRHTISAVLVLDGVPDRDAVLDHVERMSRSVPGCRHRLVTPPLGLATPLWVVDRDFDLSYHVRWIAAPEPKTLNTVLEFARQSAMSGLDRDRPLWNVTVVEGLDGGGAAVVVTLHHVLTDGVGGIAMMPFLVDATREPGDPGPMPPLPSDRMTTEAALVLDALGTQRQRVRNLVRSTGELAARSAPGLIRHPLAAAGTAVRNVQALGRMMKPPTTRLSPIMVARRGWSRFAILDVDLNTLRGAAKLHGATVNDAFLAALGNGFARYHEKHGAPVQELRAAVGVNARQAGDSPYGNQARGGTLVIPVSTDDSAKCMAACHETVALLREDVRQPLATAVGTVLGAMGPLVSPFVGALMKNCDFAAVNVPGFDAQLYLGGAEMTAMYGFGPSMGTAVNIALVSYRDRAFIGFNVDAAAIPDVAVFVECVRLGFDAVLALNQ